jgi:hypothetical protein
MAKDFHSGLNAVAAMACLSHALLRSVTMGEFDGSLPAPWRPPANCRTIVVRVA